MSVSKDRSENSVKKELEQESQFLTALQMKHDGYSNAAIARQLDIAESSVRSLLKGKSDNKPN